MKNILKYIGIGLVIVLVIAAIFSDGSEKKATTSESQAPSIAFSAADVTENSVKTELSNVEDSGYKIKLKDISRVTVVDHAGTEDPNDKIVSVYYTFTAWDDKDVVNTAAGTSVEVFRRLFANQKVARVATFAEQEFTDQYGKTELETAVKFMMNRETADKVEWDGIKNNVLLDYTALYPITEYSLHAAIRKNLE